MVGTDLDKFVGRPIEFDCLRQSHRDYEPSYADAKYIDRIEQLRGSARLALQPYLEFYRICVRLSRGPDRKRSDYYFHRSALAMADLKVAYRCGGEV